MTTKFSDSEHQVHTELKRLREELRQTLEQYLANPTKQDLREHLIALDDYWRLTRLPLQSQ